MTVMELNAALRGVNGDVEIAILALDPHQKEGEGVLHATRKARLIRFKPADKGAAGLGKMSADNQGHEAFLID
jgi:hypothetical protein